MPGAPGGCALHVPMMQRGRAAAGALLAIMLATHSADAVGQVVSSTPPTREEIDRVPVRPLADRAARLDIEGGVPAAPCALSDPRFADVRIRLDGVQFQGLGTVDPVIVESASAGLIGSEQPVSALCAIRDRAAALLNAAGYLAAVEIPEQNLAGGRAVFRVVLGRLTAVRVRGDAGPSEKLIAGYLRRLTEDDVFNRNAAERYLLLAGDLPGYDVRLSLRSAGTEPGALIGEVAVIRAPATTLIANVQNYGSRALGRFGGLLSGEIYGLTGLGDRTTISAFSTLDFAEQQTLSLGHDFRVGSEGLAISAQITGSWGNPSVGVAGVDIESTTLFATVQASYPFIRARSASLRGAIGFDLVDQDVEFNDMALTRDHARVLFGRLSFDAVDPASIAFRGGYSPAVPRWAGRGFVELRQGVDVLGASRDCRRDPAACLLPGVTPSSRLLADPTGTLIRAGGAAEVRPTPSFAIAVEGRAQYSGNALLAFEEFSAGNFTIGRGYDPGALLGDSGIGGSIELRFGALAPATRDDLAVQPYVFFDVARIWNEDPTFGRRGLSSAGGGVRALWGDRVQADVSLAIPLHRAGLQTERGDPRLLFSLTTKLLPWSFQ